MKTVNITNTMTHIRRSRTGQVIVKVVIVQAGRLRRLCGLSHTGQVIVKVAILQAIRSGRPRGLLHTVQVIVQAGRSGRPHGLSHTVQVIVKVAIVQAGRSRRPRGFVRFLARQITDSSGGDFRSDAVQEPVMNDWRSASGERFGGVKREIGTGERLQTRHERAVFRAFRFCLEAVFALEEAVGSDRNAVRIFFETLEVASGSTRNVAIGFRGGQFLRRVRKWKRKRPVDRGVG